VLQGKASAASLAQIEIVHATDRCCVVDQQSKRQARERRRSVCCLKFTIVFAAVFGFVGVQKAE